MSDALRNIDTTMCRFSYFVKPGCKAVNWEEQVTPHGQGEPRLRTVRGGAILIRPWCRTFFTRGLVGSAVRLVFQLNLAIDARKIPIPARRVGRSRSEDVINVVHNISWGANTWCLVTFAGKTRPTGNKLSYLHNCIFILFFLF